MAHETLLKTYLDQTNRMGASELMHWGMQTFENKVVFATALGAEDQVLTDMIVKSGLPIRIVTLDTGRLFPETYDLIAETEKHYNIRIQVYSPSAAAVERMVEAEGINLMYRGRESRKRCCSVRKLEPLRRALEGADAWICGLRQEQSVTRAELNPVEWDAANGLFKLSPLWNWTEQEIWRYLERESVPYNPLHDRGYPSIGCACCTRMVKRVHDLRTGRWWWELPEHKECGLHQA